MPAVQRAGVRERHGAAVALVAAVPAEAIGLNPINNIVDMTNYVMAEIAQPMHAFDADKLQGRFAFGLRAAGETIAALNGETYELNPSNLVIADDSGAIALAGVIGGADSAISATTTRIVLESANFQRQRAQDIVGAEAAHRCVDALREVAGSGEYGSRAGARGGIAAGCVARNAGGGRRRRCGSAVSDARADRAAAGVAVAQARAQGASGRGAADSGSAWSSV